MEDLLLNIETEFFFLTGTYFENFVGLFIGLFLFSLIIHFLRFENKKQSPNIESSKLSEVGDENLAKMNLSRSLIEMGQESEAKKLLEEVVKSGDLSEVNIKIANSLLDQISDGKS